MSPFPSVALCTPHDESSPPRLLEENDVTMLMGTGFTGARVVVVASVVVVVASVVVVFGSVIVVVASVAVVVGSVVVFGASVAAASFAGVSFTSLSAVSVSAVDCSLVAAVSSQGTQVPHVKGQKRTKLGRPQADGIGFPLIRGLQGSIAAAHAGL